MQAITKFESLPNELLIQSFQYLHAIDIFHAFDYLNCRLSTLIRSISLCLDLGKVENSKVTQFGIKLLLNPQMKYQIMSIILKKNEMFDNLQMLFSFVSLNEFTQLEALIFSNLEMTSINKISSMLPSLPNLQYFSIDNELTYEHDVLRSLLESTVKTVVIQTTPHQAWFSHSFMSLTHLTVFYCSVTGLCHFFKYTPMLQNLNIKKLVSARHPLLNQVSTPHINLIHLKRLAIHYYDGLFDALEVVLEHIPNLKYFMLHFTGDSDVADANRWRNLIRNVLPLLDVFKFLFRLDLEDVQHRVTDPFPLFQTDFWQHQHHWYTEYIVNKNEALIYTVPYMLDRYEIKSMAKRCYSHPLNNGDVFAKVANLTVDVSAMDVIDQYHFPHVQSLTLDNERVEENHDYAFIKHKDISSIKSMANLCNITHLEITPKFRWKSPSIICQLMNETDHLSSFKTDKTTLFQLLKNRQLCERLKMMKKLDISDVCMNAELSCEQIKKVCQVFSNMEEFQCEINHVDILQTAMDHLSKLGKIRFFSFKTFLWNFRNIWLKEHQSELDLYPFKIHCEYVALNNDDDYDDYDDDDDDFNIYNDYDHVDHDDHLYPHNDDDDDDYSDSMDWRIHFNCKKRKRSIPYPLEGEGGILDHT